MQITDGKAVKAGQAIATWDPHTRPFITEYAGQIKFENVEEGITVAKQIDDVTGLSSLVVIDPKQRAGQTKGLRRKLSCLITMVWKSKLQAVSNQLIRHSNWVALLRLKMVKK